MQLKTYIQDHFQGRQPWWQVLLVNLLGLHFLLDYAAASVGPPILWLNAIVLPWQIVGAIRTARQVLRNDADLMPQLALYATVGLITLLTLTQIIDHLTRPLPPNAVPQIAQHPQLPFDAATGQIHLQGPITFKANLALKATLAARPSAKTLVLASDGGNIFAGRALAITIAQAGLATLVAEQCFSACTIAFLAGHTRHQGPKGQLGFHGYAFDSAQRVQTLDVGGEEAKDRATFARAGVTPAFLDRAFATDPPGLWRPTRAELTAGGVLRD